MKRSLVKKVSAILCLTLLLSLLPTISFASEEVSEAAELPAETVLDPAEELPEAAPTAEAEALPAEGEEPAAAEAVTEEPAGEADDEAAPAAESPLPEADDAPDAGETVSEASEAPVEEGFLLDEFANPEDPLYAKYAQLTELGLDGAGSKTWKNFTTRSLKSNETLRYGIDVSAWQSDINWTKVKNDGVEFAFLRCAYRTAGTGKIYEDGRFRSYISGAKAAGIKVGVYIFSQAITVAEAKQEADYILQMVKNYDIDLPLVFDLEHYSGGRFTNAGLSKRTVTDMCLAFCERVEAAGYQSMVYSNPSMLSGEMYPQELGRLWLAHYTTKTSYSTTAYEYWQCTSDGIVNGISTAVDLDFWFEPKSGSTVTSTPAPSGNSSPFTDVKESDWFYDTVMTAYKAGVVTGVSDTLFSPEKTATRAQVVTMLYRTQGSPSSTKTAAFTDLTQSWYRDAVSWASEKNVVNGYSDTRFGPDRAITREELVTILYRLKGAPSVTGDLSAYTDAGKVHSWAQDAMLWAVANKIVTGYGDNTLGPQKNATRAEVCTILMRFTALK